MKELTAQEVIERIDDDALTQRIIREIREKEQWKCDSRYWPPSSNPWDED